LFVLARFLVLPLEEFLLPAQIVDAGFLHPRIGLIVRCAVQFSKNAPLDAAK